MASVVPQIQVSLPDKLDGEISRLVEQGEFVNRDQAIEDLLSRGMSAYETVEDSPEEMDEGFFTETPNEQVDPALQDDNLGDDYSY